MNNYPAYPDTSGSAPGVPASNFSDPRLPPRPAFSSAPVPTPPQQHRASFDYPSFLPPSLPAYNPGSSAPPQYPPPPNHAGPSGYMNPPPAQEQRYGASNDRSEGRRPGYNSGRDQPNHFNQNDGPGHARPGYQPQNGLDRGSDRRASDGVYPTLPPIHFTDRQPSPFERPVRDQQGYSAPFHNDHQSQSHGYGSSAPRGAHDRRDVPRENFRTRDQSGRGRSPDSNRKPPRPLAERDRDNRTVEHRMKLERACRTLFVRNVSYDADTDALRSAFEQYGQVKTYFDLVKQRGMIFITYYDLRAAGRARDGMHDSIVHSRKIDVHYSLPKDQDQTAPAKRDSNQGSVVATLLRGPYLTENQLGGLCEQYGEVKSVRPGQSPEQKIVEFYDARGATLFYDQMNNRPFHTGTLELHFIWDEDLGGAPPPPARHDFRDGRPGNNPHTNGHSQADPRGSDGGRQGRNPPRGGDRGGGGGGDRRNGDARRNGSDGRGQYGDRGHGRRGSNASHQGQRDQGPPPNRYADAPAQMAGDDRLEQARKVQDLLNSLSGSGPGGPPPPPSSQSGPPPRQNFQTTSGYQPPASERYPPNLNDRPPQAPPPPPTYRQGDPRLNGNNAPPPYPPPPSSYSGAGPRSYNYAAPIASSSPNNFPPPRAGGGNDGIPPEVLSLLQANNVAPPPHQPYIPPQNQGQGTFAPGPPFRPPSSMPPTYAQPNPPQQGYQPNGHPPPHSQQQAQGYQPVPGPGDVGTLLAMLQQTR